MKEWKTYRVGDICSSISETYKVHAKEVVLINTSDVLEGRCLNHELVPNKDLKGQFKKVFKFGDILYSEIRPANKRFAYIDFDATNYIASTKLMVIRNNDKVTNRFLYHYLKSESTIAELQAFAESRSGTFPQITFSELSQLEISIPDIETQVAISSFIDTLESKIELNRQINDNLEQQIQTLYREWFIDNPKTEWATIALSEVATFVSGYSYKGNELVDSSETAMATIKNFERNGGFKLDGYKPVSPSSKLKEEQHAELFDILVAHTDLTQNAEVIGNAEIILSKDSYRDVIFSMDIVKVVAKESFPYQFLLALLLKNPVFKSHCIGYVNGTTVLHMNKRALPDFNTQIPTCEDAARMNEIAKSIFTKMSENLSEIANLTKLRDSLLPKLMSGELEINKTDC